MPPNGAVARQSLIEAAAAEFGPKGFDSASTRAIADRAGQNIAAINYHFGSKLGLYLAVAEAIADFVEPILTPTIRAARDYLSATPHTTGDTDAYLARVLTAMARMAVTDDTRGVTLFILREQAQPSDAFDTLFNRFMRPFHETVTQLLALRRGIDPASDEAIIRAHAVTSSIMGFRVGRGLLLKRTGWDAATYPRPEHVESIVRVVIEHALAAVSAGAHP